MFILLYIILKEWVGSHILDAYAHLGYIYIVVCIKIRSYES